MKMIGNGNELRVNEATMINMVQEWIDSQSYRSETKIPLVTSVKWLNNPNSVFVIGLAEKPEKPKAA